MSFHLPLDLTGSNGFSMAFSGRVDGMPEMLACYLTPSAPTWVPAAASANGGTRRLNRCIIPPGCVQDDVMFLAISQKVVGHAPGLIAAVLYERFDRGGGLCVQRGGSNEQVSGVAVWKGPVFFCTGKQEKCFKVCLHDSPMLSVGKDPRSFLWIMTNGRGRDLNRCPGGSDDLTKIWNN